MKGPMLAVLAVVGALLFVSLDHGLPNRYVPDDTALVCALGIARDLGNPDIDRLQALVPPAGQYTTYPYLLPYGNLAVLAATYVGGRALGRWQGAGEFGEAVFADPTLAWLPARALVALIVLLLPLGVYRAARELAAGRGEAALAALLAGSSLLIVQFAHTTRPWAPMVAFGACCLAASLRLRRPARRRRARDLLLAGLFAGCATATHPVGALYFGLPALAVLQWRPRPRAIVLALIVGLGVALLVGYPSLLVYRADTGTGAIAGQLEAVEAVEIGGQAFDLGRFGGERWRPTLHAWIGSEPLLVALGWLGLLRLRRRCAGRGWLLIALPPLVVAVLFLLYDGTHVRYLMPATPFLAIGAAAVLAEIARGGRPAIAAALIALPLVQAARLDMLLGRQDTRTEAARALPALLPPGQRIAMDGYGPPLQPSAASVAAIAEQVWTTRKERRAIEWVGAGQPEPPEARDLIPIGRFWKYDSYYASDYLLDEQPLELADWMATWEIDWYVQIDRVPDEQRRAPVAAFTAAHGTLVYELSPEGGPAGGRVGGPGSGEAPGEGALPTEMSFPLTQLWQSRRPGPWVRVWKIERPGR